jgi:hypothetical protein
MGDAIVQLGNHLATNQAAHTQAILEALAAHGKPKRIRKTGNGEYVTETVQ